MIETCATTKAPSWPPTRSVRSRSYRFVSGSDRRRPFPLLSRVAVQAATISDTDAVNQDANNTVPSVSLVPAAELKREWRCRHFDGQFSTIDHRRLQLGLRQKLAYRSTEAAVRLRHDHGSPLHHSSVGIDDESRHHTAVTDRSKVVGILRPTTSQPKLHEGVIAGPRYRGIERRDRHIATGSRCRGGRRFVQRNWCDQQ